MFLAHVQYTHEAVHLKSFQPSSKSWPGIKVVQSAKLTAVSAPTTFLISLQSQPLQAATTATHLCQAAKGALILISVIHL